jgi:hypothetical protein
MKVKNDNRDLTYLCLGNQFLILTFWRTFDNLGFFPFFEISIKFSLLGTQYDQFQERTKVASQKDHFENFITQKSI